ncbi:hypothetical protein CTEN210_18446 [Chaetoceros tenuissimus]|uniref:Leucine-rich repeat domain-containing protein n=1 Tax=Chaetoceros tenuissimus TaxID=426638 RepID=A0AAD3HFQ4_9STRA|nr:hypothetical protein CTEN210_18446 [Chaetoceros tenuissimus]
MRVQTEEWRRFIPGVRMYKGKKTLFYNGENLWERNGDDLNGRPLIYDEEEREKWEVIIVLPGVEVIPECTFHWCTTIERVIMADTVKRIEDNAFCHCYRLVFVKLSRNLEFIGRWAFEDCVSLTSIFIPPSCQEIGTWAFDSCKKLIICNVPEYTRLGRYVFQNTALMKKSSIDFHENGDYDYENEEEAVRWVKSINIAEEFALHRACTSFNLLTEIIHPLVQCQGIKAMRMPNAIGITPSQYLAANPFADISEKEIVNRYILDMMGEVF